MNENINEFSVDVSGIDFNTNNSNTNVNNANLNGANSNPINSDRINNEWEKIANNVNKSATENIPVSTTLSNNQDNNQGASEASVLKNLQTARAAQSSNQKIVINAPQKSLTPINGINIANPNNVGQKDDMNSFRVNVDETMFTNTNNGADNANAQMNQNIQNNAQMNSQNINNNVNNKSFTNNQNPNFNMMYGNQYRQTNIPNNDIQSLQAQQEMNNVVDLDNEKLNTKDKIIVYSLVIASALIILVTIFMIVSVIFSGKKNDTPVVNSGVESQNDKVFTNTTEDSNALEDDVYDDSNLTYTDNDDNEEDDVEEKEPIDNISKDNNSDDITMVFGGDVLLSESMINTYNRSGGKVTNIMAKNLLDEFTNADIAMFNQEFPFSTRGTAMEDKQYTFRTNPNYSIVFNEMNISIVSLANNHILDYGTDALLDTFTTLNDAEIMYVGAGKNLSEAKETKYIEVNGIKTAFLSASRVIPVSSWGATSTTPGVFTTYDATALIQEIKNAESKADLSIVYVHWGVEHAEQPENYQVTMAKQYIDAGADVVIGCHTHCLQGMEYYKGKPIVYSMGNFIFGGNIDRTMMLKVVVDKNKDVTTQVIPCVSTSYCTKIVTDEQRVKDFYNYYKSISFGVNFDEEGYVID